MFLQHYEPCGYYMILLNKKKNKKKPQHTESCWNKYKTIKELENREEEGIFWGWAERNTICLNESMT